MSKPTPFLRGPGRAVAFVLAVSLASAALAGNGIQWRLRAQIPVMCAILDTAPLADRPASLVVTTTCNARRYRLVLHGGPKGADLRAAHSSAGPVQISGSTVTITSTRPGRAVTTIDLAAPASAGQFVVTLEPA